MGEGVNIAARLQGVADPGAICLSEQAYWQVKAENSGRRGTTPQSSAAARGSARTTQLYDRRRKRSASTSLRGCGFKVRVSTEASVRL
jgi:class 3 adenylate cyclase